MVYNSKKFNIRYQAIFNSSSAKNTIKVWIVQPSTSIAQLIENFSISHKPKKFYEDVQGNKILYFEFKNQKNITIQMDIKATLYKNKFDLDQERISLPNASNQLSKQYTKSEKFLEQTPAIKNLTHQITSENNSVLDKLQSILNFIVKNFQYHYPIKQRGVKHLNLKNLKGDCGEYSSLFVTMCRILKIPTRNNTGFVIYGDEINNIYGHGWTNVYLKPYGWIEIDPLANNIRKVEKKYIYENNNYFLTFTKGFNLKIKPKIPKKFVFNYWEKIGLPITNTSVETLQPLIFASKNKIKFSDNIKLISNIKSPN